MTPKEIEQIAEQADNHANSISPGELRPDWWEIRDKRFAALVLEHAAKECDGWAVSWDRTSKGCTSGMYDYKADAARKIADELRNTAKGLG